MTPAAARISATGHVLHGYPSGDRSFRAMRGRGRAFGRRFKR
jgi:hypothetical protein